MDEEEARGRALQSLWYADLRRLSDEELLVEREYCERELALMRQWSFEGIVGDGMVPAECWERIYGERLAWLQSEEDRRLRVATDYRSAPTGFTREWIEDVKSRVNLPHLIVSYWPDTGLKLYGDNYRGMTGRCPFHDDAVPSFGVWPTPEWHWFCFACLEGGDVYSLLLKGPAGSFQEAVAIAGKYVGMTPPKPIYPGAVAL